MFLSLVPNPFGMEMLVGSTVAQVEEPQDRGDVNRTVDTPGDIRSAAEGCTAAALQVHPGSGPNKRAQTNKPSTTQLLNDSTGVKTFQNLCLKTPFQVLPFLP